MKKWAALIITLLVLSSAGFAMFSHQQNIVKRNVTQKVFKLNLNDSELEVRANGLDPNGSFPYNLQALPLYENMKISSAYAGDVNHDGRPDVVTVSYRQENMSIYLNHGGFVNVTPDLILNSSTGLYHPTDVVIVDEQIAVSCHNDSSTTLSDYDKVLVYNLTDPTNPIALSPPVISGGNNVPVIIKSLVVGDFDDDSQKDIAAAYSTNSSSFGQNSRIAIYSSPFTNGESPKTISLGANITRMAAGDFNGDGKDDLAVILDGGKKINVYYQGTNGLPTQPSIVLNTNSSTDILAARINADNIKDLVVSNFVSGNISIYFGSSSGLEANPSLNLSAGPGVIAIGVGRFNKDHVPDIIASYINKEIYGYVEYPRPMAIFNGPLHDGQEPNRMIYAGSNVIRLQVADFDANGMDDLLVGATGGKGDSPSLPYILYQRDNSLKGIADQALHGGIYPTGITLGDVNGDKIKDLIVAETGSNSTAVFLNDGHGFPVTPSTTVPVYGYPYYVAAGHLDSDNKEDFAVSHILDNNVTLYLSSAGELLNLTSSLNNTARIWIGDINGDGKNDVVVNSYKSSGIDIFYGDHFTDGEAPNLTIPLSSPAQDFAVINLSSSNYPGIAVVLPGKLVIFNQTSPGNFQVQNTINADSGVYLVSCAAGDFNHDGEMDLVVTGLVTNYISSYAVLLQNNGNFNTAQYSGYLPGKVLDVKTGDFNDDGITDFAVPSSLGMTLIGYFNGTGFNFDYLASDQNPVSLAVGDINGDGKDDIATSTDGPDVDNFPIEMGMIDVYFQKDTPPIANITVLNYSYEGSPIKLSGENSTDTISDADSLNYTWYLWNESSASWDIIGYGVNITYIPPQQGTYNFTLKVTDKEGLYDYATTNVTVLDTKPRVNFSYYNAIEGQKTEFVADIYAYDGIYAIYWDMNGDGIWDFTNESEVNYTYAENGTYYVNLTVVDGDGSVGYVNKSVVINDTSPTCSFSYYPTTIYEGQNVTFVSNTNSYDEVVNWTWRFGNNLRYGKDVNYTFPSQGNYIVNLTVRDSDGSLGWSEQTVIVLDTMPVINFTYNGTYEGTQFHFYSHVDSYDSISSYYWDFGDGQSSKEENPTHVFAQQGSYLVTLFVNDSDGSNVSYSQLVEVEDQNPSVCFNYSNAVEGEPVQFTADIHSYDGIVSILWTFGDGGTSNETNPTHIYEQNGAYNVTVVVKEADGDSAECSKDVFVEDTSPVISLKVDGSSSVIEDSIIHLNATGTTAYDGIKEYLWDFNYSGKFASDLETKTPLATTSYPEMGHYVIALMVIDGDGSASIATVSVIVNNVKPVANFTYVVNQNEVRFDASSTYDTPSDKNILNYTWDFGDGTTGYGEIVTHTYSKPGNYTITLTVVDNDGATSQKTIHVRISSIPSSLPSSRGGFSWLLLIIILALIGALIGLLLVMNKKKYTVDDVYLIADSGVLIHHATRRLKPDMDEDILSSMLVAVQEFIKDAFKGEDNVTLKSMDFGDKKIQIHKGKKLFLAMVSSSNIPKKLENKAQEILEEIEEKYKDILDTWDGDVSAFRGVGDILKKIWE